MKIVGANYTVFIIPDDMCGLFIIAEAGWCAGIILGRGSANERWCNIVSSSLIGWVPTQNDP